VVAVLWKVEIMRVYQLKWKDFPVETIPTAELLRTICTVLAYLVVLVLLFSFLFEKCYLSISKNWRIFAFKLGYTVSPGKT
jgi:hypothetical protein